MNCPKHHRKMKFMFRLHSGRFFECPSCAMLWAKPDGKAMREGPPFIPPARKNGRTDIDGDYNGAPEDEPWPAVREEGDE